MDDFHLSELAIMKKFFVIFMLLSVIQLQSQQIDVFDLFPNTGNQMVERISTTPNNDLYATISFDETIKVAGKEILAKGGLDAVLIKYDSNKKIQWYKQFSSSKDVRITGQQVDKEGNIYLIGEYQNPDLIIEKFQVPPSKSSFFAFLTKFSPEGKLLFFKEFVSQSKISLTDIEVLEQVYVSGFVGDSQLGANTVTFSNEKSTTVGLRPGIDGFVVSYLTDGKFGVLKSFAGTGNQNPVGLEIFESKYLSVILEFTTVLSDKSINSSLTSVGGVDLAKSLLDLNDLSSVSLQSIVASDLDVYLCDYEVYNSEEVYLTTGVGNYKALFLSNELNSIPTITDNNYGLLFKIISGKLSFYTSVSEGGDVYPMDLEYDQKNFYVSGAFIKTFLPNVKGEDAIMNASFSAFVSKYTSDGMIDGVIKSYAQEGYSYTSSLGVLNNNIVSATNFNQQVAFNECSPISGVDNEDALIATLGTFPNPNDGNLLVPIDFDQVEVCAGSVLYVGGISDYTFNKGNVFYLEIASDECFTDMLVADSLSSSMIGSKDLSFLVSETSIGSVDYNYRIRSTSPAFVSRANEGQIIVISKENKGYVAINAESDNPICKGSPIQYYTNNLYFRDQAFQRYTWYVNGDSVSAQEGFTYNNYKNGDAISYKIVRSSSCKFDSITLFSDTIILEVEGDDFTVSNINDNYACTSFRSTLERANNNPGIDTIRFDESFSGAIIKDGYYTITDNVVILGPQGKISFDPNGNMELFVIDTGVTVYFENVDFINGQFGSFSGVNSTPVGAVVMQKGSKSFFKICNFSNNSSLSNGSVLGISDSCFVRLDSCYIYNNDADRGVIFVKGDSAKLEIVNSTFSLNSANAGGVLTMLGGNLSVYNSVFQTNSSNTSSNSFYNDNGRGAVFYLITSGQTILDEVHMQYNTAANGNIIYYSHRGNIDDKFVFSNSTFENNTSGFSDNILLNSNSAEITNSLFYNNSVSNASFDLASVVRVQNAGKDVFWPALKGARPLAVEAINGETEFTNVTIYGNNVNGADGMGAALVVNSGNVILHNTVIDQNGNGQTSGNVIFSPLVVLNSKGFNFIADTVNMGNQIFDPTDLWGYGNFAISSEIDVVMDQNQNVTLTPSSCSPLINSGDPVFVNELDVLGNQRNFGGAVDRGAIEAQLLATSPNIVTKDTDGSECGTFRYAINSANKNIGLDTIFFANDLDTIYLDHFFGYLEITDDLLILGPDSMITIKVVSEGIEAIKVTNAKLSVRNIRFEKFNSYFNPFIGYTFNGGVVKTTGSDVEFWNCEFANNNNADALIVVNDKSLRLDSCKFLANSGGAVKVQLGSDYLEVYKCLFQGNSDTLIKSSANSYIHNSSFINNISNGHVAVVFGNAETSNEIINSTFSGNVSTYSGAIIYSENESSTVNCLMTNNTFSDNTSDYYSLVDGNYSSFKLSFRSNIFNKNSVPVLRDNGISFDNQGYNAFDDISLMNSSFISPLDVAPASTLPINLDVLPLKIFKNSFLPVHPLGCTSPALDKGFADASLLLDQIGQNRNYNGKADIGSFEVNEDYDPFLVNLNTDELTCGTLRNAIIQANNRPGLDTILFDLNLDNRLILLESKLSPITDPVVIQNTTDIPISISGQNKENYAFLIEENADGTKIKNLGFQGFNSVHIRAVEVDDLELDHIFIGVDNLDNTLYTSTAVGVAVSNSKNIIIRNSFFAGMTNTTINDYAIYLDSCTAPTILNNIIGGDSLGLKPYGNDYGLGLFNNTTLATIHHNLILGVVKSSAIELSESNSNSILSNVLGYSADTLKLDGGENFTGISFSRSKGNYAFGNYINSRLNSAIFITSDSNTFELNVIGLNDKGEVFQHDAEAVIISNSNDNIIKGNTIVGGTTKGWGISLAGGSRNLIESNNIGVNQLGEYILNSGNAAGAILISNGKFPTLNNTISQNTIGYNGTGVVVNGAVTTTIAQNSFYCNSDSSIKHLLSGNLNYAKPIIDTASLTSIEGSTFDKDDIVEVYMMDSICYTEGGMQYLGDAVVDPITLKWKLNGNFKNDANYVALATSLEGNTSVFSEYYWLFDCSIFGFDLPDTLDHCGYDPFYFTTGSGGYYFSWKDSPTRTASSIVTSYTTDSLLIDASFDKHMLYLEIDSAVCRHQDSMFIDLKYELQTDFTVSYSHTAACEDELVKYEMIEAADTGVAPVYNWFINNQLVSTERFIETDTLGDQDEVYLSVIPVETCKNQDTTNSEVFTIEIDYYATTVEAGLNQVVCADSVLLNAERPDNGIAYWILSDGTPLADTMVTSLWVDALAPGDQTFYWFIINEKCPDQGDSVVITKSILTDTAKAGDNIEICGNTVQLDAELPLVSGEWSVIQGSVFFSDVSDPKAQILVETPDVIVLQWSVTDGLCISNDTIEINAHDTLEIDYNIIETNCEEREIDIYVQGGDGIYTFDWSSGYTTSSIQLGLPSIDENLIVYSNNFNCVGTILIPSIIEQYPVIDTIVQPLICNNDSNAVIQVFNNNSTRMVDYLWSSTISFMDTLAISDSISDLKAGEYFVLAQDEIGCTNSLSVEIINPNPKFRTVGISSINSMVCEGDQVDAELFISDIEPVRIDWYNHSVLLTSGLDVNYSIDKIGMNDSIYALVYFDDQCTTDSVESSSQLSLMVSPLPEVDFLLQEFYGLNEKRDTIQISETGVLVGNGIVEDSIFDPLLAGSGVHAIKHLARNYYGCTDSLVKTTTVIDSAGTILGYNSTKQYCSADILDTIYTIVANKDGFGTYFGSSVTQIAGTDSAVIDPSKFVGTDTIYYRYQYLAQDFELSLILEIDSTPDISLNFDSIVCLNEGDVEILVNYPANIFVDGLMQANYLIQPTVSGDFDIKAVFTSLEGCYAETQKTLKVNDLPVLSFIGLDAIYSTDIKNIQINTNPIGGDLTIDGLLNDTFFPENYTDTDSLTIQYSYQDPLTLCIDTITQIVSFENIDGEIILTKDTICPNSESFEIYYSGSSTNSGYFEGISIVSELGNGFAIYDPSVTDFVEDTIFYVYANSIGDEIRLEKIIKKDFILPFPQGTQIMGLTSMNCLDSSIYTFENYTTFDLTWSGVNCEVENFLFADDSVKIKFSTKTAYLSVSGEYLGCKTDTITQQINLVNCNVTVDFEVSNDTVCLGDTIQVKNITDIKNSNFSNEWIVGKGFEIINETDSTVDLVVLDVINLSLGLEVTIDNVVYDHSRAQLVFLSKPTPIEFGDGPQNCQETFLYTSPYNDVITWYDMSNNLYYKGLNSVLFDSSGTYIGVIQDAFGCKVQDSLTVHLYPKLNAVADLAIGDKGITQIRIRVVDNDEYLETDNDSLFIEAISLTNIKSQIEEDNENLVIQYTPANGFSGVDTILYTLKSRCGVRDEDTVVVKIQPIFIKTQIEVEVPEFSDSIVIYFNDILDGDIDSISIDYSKSIVGRGGIRKIVQYKDRVVIFTNEPVIDDEYDDEVFINLFYKGGVVSSVVKVNVRKKVEPTNVAANGVPLIVYNVLSPNGDGVNDYLEIGNIHYSEVLNSEIIEYTVEFKLSIYSKWGDLVFEGDQDSYTWDGTKKGVLVPSGVYYYFIDLSNDPHDFNKNNEVLNGFIELRK